MIPDHDHVRLAEGVSLTTAGLYDDVRGDCFEINDTGRALLEAAEGRSFGEAIEFVATSFGVSPSIVSVDARAFFHLLNERFLLNIETYGGAAAPFRLIAILHSLPLMFVALMRGLPLGVMPRIIRRRRPVDTTSAATAFASVARALSGRALFMGICAALVAGVVLAGIAAPQLGAPLAFGAAVAVGLVVHEGAHAVALRGVPCCLCLVGAAVFLLHPTLGARRRAFVA